MVELLIYGNVNFSSTDYRLKMNLFGTIVAIKRSGTDGSKFPVVRDCYIGCGLECHIRVRLNDLSEQHCVVLCIENGKVFIIFYYSI